MSLFLDIVEVAVLVEIIFFDKPRGGFEFSLGLLELYFVLTVLATIGQAVGVYLVTRRWYRTGGVVQIVSSAAQVVKLDGIVGVIGGLKAIQYARFQERDVARNVLADRIVADDPRVPSAPEAIFIRGNC